MAKGKKKENPVLALMKTGVEAYKKECVDGKVHVPSAIKLMGDKNLAYVIPAKPSDEENYRLVQGSINACVIAARLCTSEGRPFFRTSENKIAIVNHMRTNMLAQTINHVALEIQYLAGEISLKAFKLLMRDIGLDEHGNDLDPEDVMTEEERQEANEEANEEQRKLDDQSGFEENGMDFDGDDAVPANDMYPKDGEGNSEVLNTPTLAQAEGNSEPHQP